MKAQAESEEDQALVVWGRESWEALALFLACANSWRLVPPSGLKGGRPTWLGLDYPAVQAVMEMTTGRRQDAGLFGDLQILEAAAKQVLNAR